MVHSIYWGVNTSLYSALAPGVVVHIERAIWLKLTGQADAARSIFNGELEPFQHLPIVSIEHANLEFENSRWGAAWRILSSALNALIESSADLDLPEHRLIAITRAMLGIRHHGDLESAASELERTRTWLQNVSVEHYSDIQVSLDQC
jgi:hypothetical protein